jgi:hypothetical protein
MLALLYRTLEQLFRRRGDVDGPDVTREVGFAVDVFGTMGAEVALLLLLLGR